MKLRSVQKLKRLLRFLVVLGCLSSLVYAKDDDTPVHVVSYGFMDPEAAVEQAKLMLSPNGKVAANRRNNTLIVVDNAAVAQTIDDYFRNLPPLQNVRIEVQVLESQSSSNQIVGIPLGGTSLQENRVINLSILEGCHGSIMVGERIPYPVFFQQYLLGHGYIMEGIALEDVGTRLDVQPRLSGNSAEITITPVISCVADRQHRVLAIKELSTTVSATNGCTVELGGSPQNSEFTSNFFRNQRNQSLRFLLTPRW